MRSLETAPVLLTVWNRPEETQAVLDAIRETGPVRLFVAGDGPRDASDASTVAEVRKRIEAARHWNPDLTANFADSNLGCRRGMERAISWFFSEVEEGIILEDDCVPHPQFLQFATEMLVRYRNDSRIVHISGDRSMPLAITQDWSYTFIRYPHSWGWATWRDAWRNYDSEMVLWASVLQSESVADVFPDPEERSVWEPIFTRLLQENVPDSWAWRWAASCIISGGLAVQPLTNLVANVGFNARATHTTKPTNRAGARTSEIYPLRHPPLVLRSLTVERQVFAGSQRRNGSGHQTQRRLLRMLRRLTGALRG